MEKRGLDLVGFAWISQDSLGFFAIYDIRAAFEGGVAGRDGASGHGTPHVVPYSFGAA